MAKKPTRNTEGVGDLPAPSTVREAISIVSKAIRTRLIAAALSNVTTIVLDKHGRDAVTISVKHPIGKPTLILDAYDALGNAEGLLKRVIDKGMCFCITNIDAFTNGPAPRVYIYPAVERALRGKEVLEDLDERWDAMTKALEETEYDESKRPDADTKADAPEPADA